MDYYAQLCYDFCPIGKYDDVNSYCATCVNCINISDCTLCYTNGCSSGSYFNTSLSPFRCTTCQTTIPSCTDCYANSLGVFCSQCGSNLAVSSDQQSCVQCSSVIPNCETCTSSYVSVCLSCLVASQTELVGGVCVSCNSTSYYDTTTRTCLSCASVIPNCIQCTYSSGMQCFSCDPASMTILAGNQCQPCTANIQYYSTSDKKCYSCNSYVSNCETCISPNGSQCLSCQAGYNLVAGVCQLHVPSPTVICSNNCL